MTTTTGKPAPVAVNWSEQKEAKLKSKFSILTDEDLAFGEGKKDEMLAKIQARLNKSKEQVVAIIASL